MHKWISPENACPFDPENDDDHWLADTGQVDEFRLGFNPTQSDFDLVHGRPGFFQTGQGLGGKFFHHALLDQREFTDPSERFAVAAEHTIDQGEDQLRLDGHQGFADQGFHGENGQIGRGREGADEITVFYHFRGNRPDLDRLLKSGRKGMTHSGRKSVANLFQGMELAAEQGAAGGQIVFLNDRLVFCFLLEVDLAFVHGRQKSIDFFLG